MTFFPHTFGKVNFAFFFGLSSETETVAVLAGAAAGSAGVTNSRDRKIFNNNIL